MKNPPCAPDGEQTGKTGHARFIIRRKRVKQSADIYQKRKSGGKVTGS